MKIFQIKEGENMNRLLKKIYAGSVILALFANQFVPTMVYAQETTNLQNTAVTLTTSNGRNYSRNNN